jgi:6-phosphogluconate dehydrogenase
MRIGMIGLGRMGADKVRRLLHCGHKYVVFDMKADAVNALERDGALGARSIEEFVARLIKPRVISSRGEADFTDRVLSAMRFCFGGHIEKTTDKTGGV